jgi:arsenate reductase (thioredoxin)
MTKRVLILCTGNSARSQMAEGLWNQYASGEWKAESAGSSPAGYVHPFAIQAMAEIGIDISRGRSKSVDEVVGQNVDLAVTVCDNAKKSCPVLPGAKERLHWPFDDPAAATGGDDQKLWAFRRVRDEIAARIRAYLTPRKEKQQ